MFLHFSSACRSKRIIGTVIAFDPFPWLWGGGCGGGALRQHSHCPKQQEQRCTSASAHTSIFFFTLFLLSAACYHTRWVLFSLWRGGKINGGGSTSRPAHHGDISRARWRLESLINTAELEVVHGQDHRALICCSGCTLVGT